MQWHGEDGGSAFRGGQLTSVPERQLQAVSKVDSASDGQQRSIAAAVRHMQQAEIEYGLRTWLFAEERAAVLALRATSLTEYVCGVYLDRASRQRHGAAEAVVEAERRRPSGRRIHTLAEAKVLRDKAARDLERAEAAESVAMSAVGATDIAGAQLAVAHLYEVSAVPTPESAQQEWSAAMEVLKQLHSWQRKRQQWSYVRGRAQQTPQPPGGLLPLDRFERQRFGGALLSRRTESGPAGTIASAVELIARWDLSGDPRARAEPTVAALEAIRGVRRGEHSETGPAAIASFFRSGDNDVFDELDWEEDNDDTLTHIAEMRVRVSQFFGRFGEPIRPGTWAISSERFQLVGHIDFVSADTIWDLKVSSTGPSKVDLLQLLLYWVVFNDDPENNMEIAYVGFCNPRMDVAWRMAVADIPGEVISSLKSVAMRERPTYL